MACSCFRPKREIGPLSKWCINCDQHYDAHIGVSHSSGGSGTDAPKSSGKKKSKKPTMDDGPRPGGGSDEAEAGRIWERLGGEAGKGDISFEAIVYHSRYLEGTFPPLVTKYAEIADHGRVSWDAFLRLFKGGGEDPAAGGREFSRKEIRGIFKELDSDGSGQITLENVIEKKKFVQEYLPELLSSWSEIDVDDSHTINWDEFRTFFGGSDEWLEFQFSEVVGLDSLKDQIRGFHRSVALDEARRKRGHAVDSGGGKYHMIFQGNPGTGKTSMGRIIAKLLHRAGIAKSTTLREVQREQLVGEYVGQTAGKTQKEIDGAIGGILFIDEAYRLSQGGEKDFGKEAIEQLMGAMNDPPDRAPIMVFAGYPADMSAFMSKNDGLYRRIPYTFDFPDYSCSDLAEILCISVNKKGYEIEKPLLDHGRSRLADIIEKNTLPRARELMNGGMAERIFTLSKQALDARDDPSHPTVVLNRNDILTACRQIPPPPEPSSSSGGSGGSGGASGGSGGTETRRLRQQVQELQKEVSQLQRQNRALQEELGAYKRSGPSSPIDRSTAPPRSTAPARGTAPAASKEEKKFQVKFREWTDFDPDVQEILIAARESGESCVRFSTHGKEFEVDFERMVQRGVGGGREREVREISSGGDSREAYVRKMFSALDLNNNKELSRVEMSKVLRALDPGLFTKESVKMLFEAADADSDGIVSLEEFSCWLLKDGDGQEAVKSTLAAHAGT